MINLSEKQIEAAALKLCEMWAADSRFNPERWPTAKWWGMYRGHFIGTSRAMLEAAWKVWWEGVASRSEINEQPNKDNDPRNCGSDRVTPKSAA